MPKKALIVLGAGASYDCDIKGILPASGVRMPLVDLLFDDNLFQSVINDMRSRGSVYNGASSIGHLYMSAKQKQDISLEKFIDNILINKREDKSYQRYIKNVRQLVSYIRTLIGGIGVRMRDVSKHTGYHNLVDHFSTPDYEKVIFLTTNYDLLLDWALSDLVHMPLNKIEGYIEHDEKWSLVKFHGSVNWTRIVTKDHYPGLKDDSNDALIDTVCSIDPSAKFLSDIPINVYSNHYEHRWNAGSLLYPVMVLPTILGKRHVCPSEHIEAIIPTIREATELWVIGNSMTDDDVTSLIKTEIKSVQDVHLIDRSIGDAGDGPKLKSQICRRITDLMPHKITMHENFIGFSSFVKDHL